MTWTPENVIAAAATGVALVSVIVTAVVSVVTARTSVRLQQREAAVSRRRDVHLRFWRSAKLMRVADYGIEVGKPADLVVLDCTRPEQAIAELAAPLMGFKRGRRTFTRAPVELHRPAAA